MMPEILPIRKLGCFSVKSRTVCPETVFLDKMFQDKMGFVPSSQTPEKNFTSIIVVMSFCFGHIRAMGHIFPKSVTC